MIDMKKSVAKKIIFSLLTMVITIVLIYLAELYLDAQIAQTGSIKLIGQILIGTIGVFWALIWTPLPLRHNIYFALGLIAVAIALYLLAGSQLNISIITLVEVNVFESMTLVMCGMFFMSYVEFKLV